MPQLTGGYERVDLGSGYTLVAPGLRGRAERYAPGVADIRAVERTTPLLDDMLAQNDMAGISTIDITAVAVPTGPATADLRDPHGDDALLLEVPDLGPRAGQVVLSVDEAGALSWHFPLDGGKIQTPSERGSGDKKRFLIPRRVPPAPPEGAARDRALFGAIGRKLLKVIVYPITDVLLATPLATAAELWESTKRAYGIRDFSPENYRQPTGTREDRERLALTPTQLAKLTGGRALLFVHGTFSNAHGAFSGLPPELISELHGRYGGRVFAFNHYSMAHDPPTNVRRFLDGIAALSDGARLEVDIVCHSRGGLVARTLAEGKSAFGIDTSRIDVRRVAFVAVPNQGTLLADPDHMVEMIDRLTSALNVVPAGSSADWLEGILIAVKIVGHAALNALAGLHSMHPKGKFLQTLNHGGRRDAEYMAIAADYEPTDVGLRALVSRSGDALVDRVFESVENDLVVPERGVYDKNGSDSFPISMDRCLKFPGSAGVTHTTMFGRGELIDRLDAWLKPAG